MKNKKYLALLTAASLAVGYTPNIGAEEKELQTEAQNVLLTSKGEDGTPSEAPADTGSADNGATNGESAPADTGSTDTGASGAEAAQADTGSTDTGATDAGSADTGSTGSEAADSGSTENSSQPAAEAPAEPVQSEAPAEPAQTEAPAEPVQTEAPEPVQTEAPEPVQTEAPTEPAQTETPTEPAQTEVPTEPAQTETPTEAPQTEIPTEAPQTEMPTEAPQTEMPTEAPQTEEPTEAPQTEVPTEAPTETETPAQTEMPTESETYPQTETEIPTETETPSEIPTETEQPSETETVSETESETWVALEIETETETETEALPIVVINPAVVIPGFSVDPSKYPPANISKNTTTIYWYLRDVLGLNHAAACGVLGNIQMESNFNPLALGDSGSSYGICQWHLGRFSALISFCKNNGLDYNTLEGQLAYLSYEFRGLYSATYQYLLSVPDTAQGAYDAAYYMCIHFESPSEMVARGQQRGNLARNEYYGKVFEHPEEEEAPQETRKGRIHDTGSAIAKEAQERSEEELKILLIEVVETGRNPETGPDEETAPVEETKTRAGSSHGAILTDSEELSDMHTETEETGLTAGSADSQEDGLTEANPVRTDATPAQEAISAISEGIAKDRVNALVEETVGQMSPEELAEYVIKEAEKEENPDDSDLEMSQETEQSSAETEETPSAAALEMEEASSAEASEMEEASSAEVAETDEARSAAALEMEEESDSEQTESTASPENTAEPAASGETAENTEPALSGESDENTDTTEPVTEKEADAVSADDEEDITSETETEDADVFLSHALESYGGTVKTALFVREEPDPESTKINILREGASVTVLDDPVENGFVPVEFHTEDGVKGGFVQSYFLETEEHKSEPAETEPAWNQTEIPESETAEEAELTSEADAADETEIASGAETAAADETETASEAESTAAEETEDASDTETPTVSADDMQEETGLALQPETAEPTDLPADTEALISAQETESAAWTTEASDGTQPLPGPVPAAGEDSSFETELPEETVILNEEAGGDAAVERDVKPLFFGDSRVVGMSQSAPYYSYVGKVSAGYTWMTSDGASILEQQISGRSGKDVVFCFGVNDLKNVQEYISYYRTFTEAHPQLRVWFMSVNPVSEAVEQKAGYSVTNQQIEEFNEELRAAFPAQYIDTYSYLLAGGFSTGDGVHYGADTYAAIQNYAVASIQANL